MTTLSAMQRQGQGELGMAADQGPQRRKEQVEPAPSSLRAPGSQDTTLNLSWLFPTIALSGRGY